MRQARYAGVALLVTTLALLVAFTSSDPGLESGDDKEAFAAEVAGAASRVPEIGWALAIQMSLAALGVLAGVGLHRLVRHRAPGLGLVGSAMLALFGLFHAIQAMVGAAMVSAAQSYVDGGLVEAGSDQVLELLKTLGRLHWTAWLAAWGALAVAVAGYGYGLSLVARVTPRWLGGLGIGAGVLLGTIPLGMVLELFFLTWFLGVVLTFAWLLVTAVWLIARARRIGASADPRGEPAGVAH